MPPLTDNAHQTQPVVGTVRFHPLTRWEAANHVRDEMVRGRGGRVMVLTHEQLRHVDDAPALRPALADAELVLAGSATAVWASRVAGTPLPERITGPALADALCAACNSDGRRVYLVGGAPGRGGVPSAAQRAAAVLGIRHQGLRVAGCVSPTATVATDRRALADVVADIVEAKPDLVLIGADHVAAEEALVRAVRGDAPTSWLFGWTGLVRELAGDPGHHRGGRRVHVSYAARLLARAAAARVARATGPRDARRGSAPSGSPD